MVALDFRFGGDMQTHRYPITFTGVRSFPPWLFRLLRSGLGTAAHLIAMTPTRLGLEPLIRVEKLAEYLGVPVQTIYDWRMTGRAPRAHKFGKHLRFAVSYVQVWLDERHEGGHE